MTMMPRLRAEKRDKSNFLGTEFFRIPTAYAHCPYCGTEFKVGVAAKADADKESNPR